MYLVPQHGTLVGVSYRPVMAAEPIVWKGAITKPGTRPARHRKKAAS